MSQPGAQHPHLELLIGQRGSRHGARMHRPSVEAPGRAVRRHIDPVLQGRIQGIVHGIERARGTQHDRDVSLAVQPRGQAVQRELDEGCSKTARIRNDGGNVRLGNLLVLDVDPEIVHGPRIDIRTGPCRRGRYNGEDGPVVRTVQRSANHFKVHVGIVYPEEAGAGALVIVHGARAVGVLQVRAAHVFDRDRQPGGVERGYVGHPAGTVDKRVRDGDVVGARRQREFDEPLRVFYVLFDVLVGHGHAVRPRVARIVERIVDGVGVAPEIVEGDAEAGVKAVAVQRARRERGGIDQRARVVVDKVRRGPLEFVG